MKIGMVLDRPFPPDDRVEKEALSLVKAGFEVHLLCFTHKNEKRYEQYKGIHVHRVFAPLWFFKKFSPLILTLPLYAIFWRKKMQEFVISQKIDVLHIHDLPLVGEALRIKAKMAIPIVADMHENYPEFIAISRHTNTLTGKVLVSKKAWRQKEKEWLAGCDAVVCVVEEMARRLQNRGIRGPEFLVVPNTIDVKQLFSMQQPDPKVEQAYKDGFNVLFWGRFDTARGLPVFIEAVNELKTKIPNLKALLVGDGSIKPELQSLAKKLGVQEMIAFEGWQPLSKIESYLKVSQIAVIPHYKTPQTDNSSPNKLFQFMAFGRAIVASNCNSIERIIRENECGLIFESGNAAELAQSIWQLYRDPDLREKMGRRGKEALMQKYRWEMTVQPLIDYYARLAGNTVVDR